MAFAALQPEDMFAAIRARKREFNGVFVTGVLTTGIYCLPSCPARTPKFQNIRFFKKPREARAAGLRACLRCRPDDFYADIDPDREIILEIARRMADTPGAYGDAAALISASGLGATKFNSLWREHFHASPKRSLMRAKAERAATLLRQSAVSLDEVAEQVGCESLSTFHDLIRQRWLLSPGVLRQLQAGVPFALRLPDDFRMADTLRYLQRDGDDPLQSWQGMRLLRTFRLGDGAGLATLDFSDDQVRVTYQCEASQVLALHDQVLRLLGLPQDTLAFERLAAKQKLGSLLMEDGQGLRLPQTPTPFEALVWAIIGQQINLAFAYTLRQRLIRHFDHKLGELWVHPSAQDVAALDERDLQALQFSKAKSAYLITAAKAVVDGSLALDQAQVQSAPILLKRLLAVRGIGNWTAQYVLMRGFGFADCAPQGDAGTRQGLRLLMDDTSLNHAEVDAFLQGFSPYQTLATAHLWRIAAKAAKKGS